MAWGEKADKKVTAEMDAEYGQICKITPESIARMAGSQGDRDEAIAAMTDINKETDKAKRIMRFKKKMSTLSAGAQSVLKKAAGMMTALMLAVLLAGPARAAYAVPQGDWLAPQKQSWYAAAWEDLKANSSLNLGQNIAYGWVGDFVYGKNLTGFKHSIYNYRFIHLEYGAMFQIGETRTITHSPMHHTIGPSIYIRPFVNWALIPDDFIMLKQLYIGPVSGYDLHRWTGGIQVHLPFTVLNE